MDEKYRYIYYNKRNSLKWLQQGIIDKHFFKPKGKEYHYITKKIGGRPVLELEDANQLLIDSIVAGKPFWMARYGHTELQFINSVLYKRYVGDNIKPCNKSPEFALEMLCNNAGFFPYDINKANEYVDKVIEAANNVDIHAYWDLWMEEYVIACLEPKSKIIRWGDFAPYYQRKEQGVLPWTSALAGKKVLVINPFAESISNQYHMNREHLFEKIFGADEILPQFELKTLKAVQTAGGQSDSRFSTWFEALDWMIDECANIDFDIALVGCGAYGFLIANAIKNMGKSAIQSCGCTQILFGVLGKRWTDDKVLMSEVVNDYWTRPMEKEKILGMNKIEEGCYW